jgi:carbon storage regulator
MLVLSRKRGETVRIGQDITLTFLGIRGRVMRVGIDAPSFVRILRGELCGEGGPPQPVDDRARGDPVALAAHC